MTFYELLYAVGESFMLEEPLLTATAACLFVTTLRNSTTY